MNSFFAYDTFDQLFTVILLYILACIIKDDNRKLWLIFGIVAGVGLMTKISMGFTGIALLISLVLVKERSHFKSVWLWAGGLIAIVLFVPYILWQVFNGFPTYEYLSFYALHRTYHADLLEYILMQIFIILPLSLPLWGMGLWFIFADREGKQFRLFGWMFLFLNVFLFVIKAKVYMISALYVPLLAAGAVFFEKRFFKKAVKYAARTAYATIIAASGIVFALAYVPVLPPETLVRYYKILPFGSLVKTENTYIIEFPQFVADRFGWKELAHNVKKVYDTLSSEEQKSCVIYTKNYGEAGAIDAYRGELGLPPAYSGHLSYYLWKPAIEEPLAFISIGFPRRDLSSFFGTVELVLTHTADYSMPREKNLQIFIYRGIKYRISEIWEKTKHFD